VQTVSELGLKNFTASSWNGLAAPAKTPTAIINVLNKAAQESVNDPEVKAKLNEIFIEAHASSSKDMRSLLETDIKRWGSIIDKARIPKQ